MVSKISVENKQGVIYADDANEILKALAYKSYESEYRIVIIWMVEKLQHMAAPKLLKILEEPPEKTLFILLTENSDQILSTIKSRTQLVKIPAINDEDMLRWLQTCKLSDMELMLHIVSMSDGNIVQARLQMNDTEQDSYNFTNFSRLDAPLF